MKNSVAHMRAALAVALAAISPAGEARAEPVSPWSVAAGSWTSLQAVLAQLHFRGAQLQPVAVPRLALALDEFWGNYYFSAVSTYPIPSDHPQYSDLAPFAARTKQETMALPFIRWGHHRHELWQHFGNALDLHAEHWDGLSHAVSQFTKQLIRENHRVADVDPGLWKRVNELSPKYPRIMGSLWKRTADGIVPLATLGFRYQSEAGTVLTEDLSGQRFRRPKKKGPVYPYINGDEWVTQTPGLGGALVEVLALSGRHDKYSRLLLAWMRMNHLDGLAVRDPRGRWRSPTAFGAHAHRRARRFYRDAVGLDWTGSFLGDWDLFETDATTWHRIVRRIIESPGGELALRYEAENRQLRTRLTTAGARARAGVTRRYDPTRPLRIPRLSQKKPEARPRRIRVLGSR